MDLNPDWTPIRIASNPSATTVDWCHTAGVLFDDPFFAQTVERCLADPFRLLFRHETSMDDLGRFADRYPGVPPAGFVFHLSRCGSTLVSQMLASVPTHLVLSEAEPIDAVLRGPADRPTLVRWLRWMVAALGQPRHAGQRRMFVKFDAWSALALPVIREAFPAVPWIFLYREPVEILVSHARHRGAHLTPGVLPPALFGLAKVDGCPPGPLLGLEDYGARVLAAIAEAALAAADGPGGALVNYAQLPSFVLDDLPPRWHLPLDAGDLERMRAAARMDAKNPVLPFEDDRDAKRRAATPEIRAAAERHLAGVYARLEARRAC